MAKWNYIYCVGYEGLKMCQAAQGHRLWFTLAKVLAWSLDYSPGFALISVCINFGAKSVKVSGEKKFDKPISGKYTNSFPFLFCILTDSE